MIKLTGITDEGSPYLDTQIQIHQQLGWPNMEVRMVELEGVKANFHDLPDALFEQARDKLNEAGMHVCCFGSVIGNWAHSIEDDFAITLEEIERTIPRMQKLGSRLVRIMSYAVLKDKNGVDLPNQKEAERFRRVREIVRRFADAGIIAVHENCMNYGGMSVSHALRLQEEVPELKWAFDTANPVFNEDRDHPGHMQDPWPLYQALRPHIAHVHIKDCTFNSDTKLPEFTYPGAGDGKVETIIKDLISTGYSGFLSIEPHVAVVFHNTALTDGMDPEIRAREQMQSYLRYGRELEEMVKGLTQLP